MSLSVNETKGCCFSTIALTLYKNRAGKTLELSQEGRSSRLRIIDPVSSNFKPFVLFTSLTLRFVTITPSSLCSLLLEAVEPLITNRTNMVRPTSIPMPKDTSTLRPSFRIWLLWSQSEIWMPVRRLKWRPKVEESPIVYRFSSPKATSFGVDRERERMNEGCENIGRLN